MKVTMTHRDGHFFTTFEVPDDPDEAVFRCRLMKLVDNLPHGFTARQVNKLTYTLSLIRPCLDCGKRFIPGRAGDERCRDCSKAHRLFVWGSEEHKKLKRARGKHNYVIHGRNNGLSPKERRLALLDRRQSPKRRDDETPGSRN